MNSINNAESANQIGYNNSTSRLIATDVQGAIDEVSSSLEWKQLNNPQVNVTAVSESYTAYTSAYNELKTANEILIPSPRQLYCSDFHLIRRSNSNRAYDVSAYILNGNYFLSIQVLWDWSEGKIAMGCSNNTWGLNIIQVHIPAGIFYR